MAEDFLSVMKVLPDPVGSFMQGQQQSADLAATQSNTQVQQYQLQQAQQQQQAQAQQQAAYQQAVGQFIQKPTAEGAANLALQFPNQQKAITDAWNMRDAAVNNADRQQLANVYSLLNNGYTDQAQKLLEARQLADQQAGKSEPMVDMLLQTIKTNPDHAKGVAAYALASIPGGEDFAKVLDKMGDTSGNVKGQVVGRAIGHYEGDKWITDYRDPESPQYKEVRNADGTTSVVQVGGGSPAASGAPSARYTGGWTPRARNGGDNPDNVVDNKITGAARFLGVDPTADISGLSPAKIAQAMALSEGGAGSLADRNNNPGNLRNQDGSYKSFPSKQAGLAAAAALVARKLKSGQTTVQSLIEGLPVGGATAQLSGSDSGLPAGPTGNVVFTSKGGDPVSAPGDTTKTGDAYLATIPSDLANRARALLQGRTPYPSQAALRSPQMQQLLAAAQQADPSFDAATWFRRKKTATDYSPGGVIGQTLTSGKTVINHLYELAKESEALGGADGFASSWINGAVNAGRRVNSNVELAKYNQARTLVAPELAKFLTGKAPAEGEINRHYDALDPNQGPAARKARIAESIALIAGRFGPLVQGYQDAMGQNFDIDKAVPGGAVSSKLAALTRWANGGQLEPKQGGQQGGGQLPTLTPQQAASLPSGARFRTTDGRVMVKR